MARTIPSRSRLPRRCSQRLRALLKNSVSGQQPIEFIERFRKIVLKLLDAPLESRGQVHHQTANAKIRWSQTTARRGFDQVHDLFPLAKAVKEDRHRAEIERVRR